MNASTNSWICVARAMVRGRPLPITIRSASSLCRKYGTGTSSIPTIENVDHVLDSGIARGAHEAAGTGDVCALRVHDGVADPGFAAGEAAARRGVNDRLHSDDRTLDAVTAAK